MRMTGRPLAGPGFDVLGVQYAALDLLHRAELGARGGPAARARNRRRSGWSSPAGIDAAEPWLRNAFTYLSLPQRRKPRVTVVAQVTGSLVPERCRRRDTRLPGRAFATTRSRTDPCHPAGGREPGPGRRALPGRWTGSPGMRRAPG